MERSGLYVFFFIKMCIRDRRDFAFDDEMTAEELIQAMDDGFATDRK